MSVDKANGPAPLVDAWRASGRQVSVAVGAAAALLSLLSDAPIHVASLRGAIAFAATLAATTVGAWFAERAWTPGPTDGAEADPGASEESATL